MGHIQQGDTRQYFSNGIQELDTSGQYAGMLSQGLNSAVTITQKANESIMANNQIDLSTKYLAENNRINTKYQADPTNPQREVELQQAFESLANQYKINPACQKQWADIKSNVYNRYKTYNAQWVENQQQTNIQTNLKNGYENLTNQISMLGLNGASVDEMRLIYANGIEGLRNGAVAGLGEVVVDNFLKDANHDVMTTYISALALNNPLEAQKLLNDEGVRNDIGRAETLEKLESYVTNSIKNQSTRTAFNELGNTLRNINSEDADNILSGKADLNRVMKFIETNKNLPEGSKNLILGIYGLGSKTDYYYDRDKKRIVKKDESGSSSGSSGSANGHIPAAKMTQYDKQLCAEQLEQDLHRLISFEDYGINDVKSIKKNKTQQQASDNLIGFMQNVASMQERIDTACNTGAITKDERKRLMDSYIAPITDYLEQNLDQLDEKGLIIAGNKLGYDKIKKQFSTDGLKGQELKDIQRQKLFAQNYYLDELYQAAKSCGMKNIYDIESLPSRQQQEIYKLASERALLRAERWTDKPEYFFAKEFPDIYMQPSVYFKANEAKIINHAVAEALYKRKFENTDGTNKIDDLKTYAQLKCTEEIQKKYKENQIKANKALDLKNTEAYISQPEPKSIDEFYNRIKALGFTPEQFMEDARKRGFLNINKPNSIKESFQKAWKEKTGQINSMAEYYYALQEAERAKALQDKRK